VVTLPRWSPILAFVACAPAAPPANAPVAAPCPSPQVAVTAAPPAPSAAPARSTYDKPPQAILDVLRAPAPPSVYVAPGANDLLLVRFVEYPSIARVAEPFLRLAGVRVEPRNHSRHDASSGYGIKPCVRDLAIVRTATSIETKIPVPEGSCFGGPSWSADGAYFALENSAESGVELWIGETKTGALRKIPGVRLNPILGDTIDWLGGRTSLIVKLVPSDLGPPPPTPIVPPGPRIQETKGERGQSSTYEARDTLTSAHDEALFDHYATSELAIVDVTTGAIEKISGRAIHARVDAAPDGEHVLVTTIQRPYSYVTTYERFARKVEVLDPKGKGRHLVASLPVADRVPIRGVPKGPRAFAWRATEPATLTWAEALDEGDWNVKVPARDRILSQRAPFASPPVEITKTVQRFSGFSWSETKGVTFLHEYDDNRHWRRTSIIDVDDPKAKPRTLFDLSSDEKYDDPGRMVHKRLPNGAWVVRQEGDAIYLAGQGATPEGDRPFLDRLELSTKKRERLFRSEKSALERFVDFRSQAAGEKRILTWHQSPTDPPNAWLRTLGEKIEAPAAEATYASSRQPITKIPDPTPAVRAIKKRLVKYKRKDGVDLSFTLYTPPGWTEGTRLPTIVYAYPLDYAEAKQAGQVTGSDQTFVRLSNYRLLLLAGYAIVDHAAFPIVGDPKKAYDTYLEQLVANAKAAVDKAVELGVADRDRIGVTGHSHGALMTVNLLAHSDLFRAGVATSGSYNKTLTPFGFQNERRSVWEAQSVYLKASPFFFADKIKRPILIMHGEDDANPGTTPLQATKLFEAIRGNGGITRLVMLPHEPHWYTALESNEQLVAEMLRWFDLHVKGAKN
jgi:dipeptidyl aminopeptidase/acylaminoacyl peptidase